MAVSLPTQFQQIRSEDIAAAEKSYTECPELGINKARTEKVIIKVVTIKEGEAQSILTLWKGAPEWVEEKFVQQYGKIKELLHVRVQHPAIFEMIKFWIPNLRVFTFGATDLTPTLEEYADLLGLPLKPGARIFRPKGNGQVAEWLSPIIDVPVNLLKKAMNKLDKHTGWTFQYMFPLLEKAKAYNDWPKFIFLTALLIYGLVLFPVAGSRIDIAAIEILREVYDHKVHPVPVILAETFLAIDRHSQGYSGVFLGSATLLFAWVAFHLFPKEIYGFIVKNRKCLRDFNLLELEKMSSRQWYDKYASLREKEIKWVVPWLRHDGIIVRCGRFLNIPLLGLRGYITYSPILVMRQFQYRQLIPIAGALEGHKQVFQESGMGQIGQIIEAWRDVTVLKDESRLNQKGDKTPGFDEWRQQKIAGQNLRKEKAEAEAPYTPGQLFSHHLQTKGYEGQLAYLKQKIVLLQREVKTLKDQSPIIEELQRELIMAKKRSRSDANLLEYWANREDETLLEAENRINAVKENALIKDNRLQDELDRWKEANKHLEESLEKAKAKAEKISLSNVQAQASYTKLKAKTDEEIDGWKQAYRLVKDRVKDLESSVQEAWTLEKDLMEENSQLRAQLDKFMSS